MTETTLPKSIVIFGETVRLRKYSYGENRGKLGDIIVEVDHDWAWLPRVRLNTSNTCSGACSANNHDGAARKAERAFLKAAAKRIERNVAETKTLRALIRKHGGK